MVYTGNEHVDCKAPFMNERNRFLKQLNKPINLLLLGDSITEGYNIPFYYPTSQVILNSGLSGDRIMSLSPRLKRDVLDYNPESVLLNIGINDLMHFEITDLTKLEARIDELFSEYQKNIDFLLKSNCQLYVASIIKIAEQAYDEVNHHFANYMFINKQIDILNQKISEYCNETNVIYIDYNHLLTNEYNQLDESFSYDGLHMNQKGYYEITKLLIEKGVLT